MRITYSIQPNVIRSPHPLLKEVDYGKGPDLYAIAYKIKA